MTKSTKTHKDNPRSVSTDHPQVIVYTDRIKQAEDDAVEIMAEAYQYAQFRASTEATGENPMRAAYRALLAAQQPKRACLSENGKIDNQSNLSIKDEHQKRQEPESHG